MAKRFSVEAVFKAVDKVTKPISRMQNRVQKMTRSIDRSFHRLNKRIDNFGSKAKNAAIGVGAGLAITTTAMAGIITTGAEFEQTLVNAAAKFPGGIQKGTEAFKALEDAAMQTGETTEFTASQSAEALNFLAMAGFDAESSISALPGVVDLATAAQVDLAMATDVATDSLGAFNLMGANAEDTGKNLARINNVIAKTTTSANTTVEQLFETIKQGAPVATTAGASVETFAALAGELANAGIKASDAGTTLKNVFLRLSAPVGEGAKLLRRFGIQTQDANGDMLDIVDILGQLETKLDGLGTAQRSAVLNEIFGKIPIAGVNVLLAAGSEKLDTFRKALEGDTDAMDRMAKMMRDTVQGRLKTLNSAIQSVSLSLFNMNKGPLADAIDKMTKFVRTNKELIATNITRFVSMIVDNFSEIVKWLKRIGIGLVAFVTLSTLLKTIIASLTAINLIAAANPFVLITAGVVSLTAALVGAVKWWNKLEDETKTEIFDKVGDQMDRAFRPIARFLRIGDDEVRFGDPDQERQKSQIVSPQERVARSIEEKNTISKSEVTITTPPGTNAEVSRGKLGKGVSLIPSGAF